MLSILCSSTSSTPSKRKRKRLRSITPSEAGGASDSDNLRSPLAKRKKLAADRSGTSKLKEAISAEDIVEEDEDDDDKPLAAKMSPSTQVKKARARCALFQGQCRRVF